MTQDPRAVAKTVMDSIDTTFGDYYKEVDKIAQALTDARRQGMEEAAKMAEGDRWINDERDGKDLAAAIRTKAQAIQEAL